jgi:hypothetical protein
MIVSASSSGTVQRILIKFGNDGLKLKFLRRVNYVFCGVDPKYPY